MKKNCMIIISAFLATLGVYINLSSNIQTDSLVANSILFVVFFGLFIMLIKKASLVKDRRLMLYAFLAAVIISAIQIVGRSLEQYNYLLLLYVSSEQILLNCLEFIGLTILLFNCLVLLFDLVLKRNFTEIIQNTEVVRLSTKNKALLIWLIIFIAWLPYFLINFPGIITIDSIRQIEQALWVSPWTNHHPIFHTFLIQICMKIGSVFGSNMAGVAIYSIFQMIVMSGIFAFSLFYMEKRNIHRYLRRAAFVYFAFFPIHAMYSVTMWKDILFAGAMLLFTICVIELVVNPDRLLTSRKYLVAFILITFFVMLLRNNGFYIILLSCPFIIIAIKEYRKKLILIFALVLILYVVYTGPIFSALNIAKSSPGESLSIPLQQMARIAAFRGDRLNADELKVIDGIFSSADIAEYYNPRFAIYVKNHFNPEFYNSNKMLFYSTWIKMSFRFPKESIESYLANSFGYWYPEARYTTVTRGVKTNDFGILHQPLLPEQVNNAIIKSGILNKRDIPVISMVYSIGFGTLLVFLSICLVCIKKQRRYLIIYIPIVFLLLTVTASPIYAEFRYIYGMFTSLPILVSFSLHRRCK